MIFESPSKIPMGVSQEVFEAPIAQSVLDYAIENS